jgi:hypothetical protein
VDDVLLHYREHGWARVGRVLDGARLERLRARTDEIMLGRVVHPGLFFQRDTTTGDYQDLEFGKGWQGPSLNYRKIEKLEKDPLFWDWIRNPIFEEIARGLIPGPIAIYRAVLFNKASTGGTELPFHQDGGRFWGLDRDPSLQIWTALDDTPLDGGCIELVPGSHTGGLATPLGGVIPQEVVTRGRAHERSIPLPAQAGEVLLVHNYVWHRSGVNRTGHPRRALSICYMSAATRCLRTKRAPRQFVRVFD